MSCFCLLDCVLIALGLYVLIPRILAFLSFLKANFFISEKDIHQRYSQGDSWAIVTGCTSGIGEEMAHRLAQKGFNIVLISRNMDRLMRVQQEIQKECNGQVKTKCVQADFSKGYDLNIYERIAEEIKDLDIAILINNAGVNTRGLFKDIDIQDIYDMAIVNTYPYAFLTHKLISQLKRRKQKSLILTICSLISLAPHAYDALYAATKVFEAFQFEALRLENQESDIDFLIVNPQYVSTNNARLQPGGFVETPKSFVDSVMVAIGNVPSSFGTFKHSLFGLLVEGVNNILKHFTWQQYVNERIIKKKTDSMWKKRV